MQEFKTIKNDLSNEIIEKKSRFIANIFYIETEEEAKEKIKEIKAKYYDARHNCYAYRVLTESSIKDKSSDDGEPGGTAGAPILNAITKNELVNVLVVITRYFGGILLGAGGLVRAYSDSTLEVIKKSDIIDKKSGYLAEIEVVYRDVENIKYILKTNNINIIDIIYEENVILKIEIDENYKVEIENDTSSISKFLKNFKFLCAKYIDK
ncbi:MAG: YigZ family protein [Clostridia bacterium]|nr:YigZ family protein [Clostridia bacterium]